MSQKSITILGSTGSVGQSTVDLIQANKDAFTVQALTAYSNVEKLAVQAIELSATHAVIGDESLYKDLKSALSGTDVSCAAGRNAVIEAAAMPADWTMAAITGMAGLEPLMHSIGQGNAVAIANKEPLVAAGEIVMSKAYEHGTKILPVDSEHNGVFQCLDPKQIDHIRRIVLTASGGPFRTWTKEQMAVATPAQAVAHPNWSMGAKISVDSATMMNKALEVIEAHYLFDMPADKIDVRVHPQSIVHAMVEYSDGSVLSHMGAPDMRTPIAHALSWPDRMASSGNTMDWDKLQNLTFSPVDDDLFPFVHHAYDCINNGTASCVAFNAANEVAVEAFLNNNIGFLDIYNIVISVIKDIENVQLSGLDDILQFDFEIREKTRIKSKDAA